MAHDIHSFIANIVASTLISREDLDAFMTLHPAAANDTAEELARRLTIEGLLTKYQARVIYQGKPRGLVLDRYVIQSTLGRGGMGTVFKAVHSQLKRTVALKVLSSELAKSKRAVERFRREVVAIAGLDHPNIVRAYDACEHEGIRFFVMELVDGNDLSHWVKQNGPLSAGQAVNFIKQAAQGLEYAHGKGIVHRDIKPHNLLVGRDGIVKISDLGLARARIAEDEQENLTTSGQVLGTVDYMAPEQAEDTRNATERSDVYSLGCTLYYLLTGKAPYGGESYVATILAHMQEPIPSVRAVAAHVPESVEQVLQRCLAKQPEDRFRSMTELIAALEAVEQEGAAPSDLPNIQPTTDTDAFPQLNLELSESSSPSFLKSRSRGFFSGQERTLGMPKCVFFSAAGGLAVLALLLAITVVSTLKGDGKEVATTESAPPLTNDAKQVGSRKTPQVVPATKAAPVTPSLVKRSDSASDVQLSPPSTPMSATPSDTSEVHDDMDSVASSDSPAPPQPNTPPSLPQEPAELSPVFAPNEYAFRLKDVATLPNLETVFLDRSNVSDAGVAQLASALHLHAMWLDNTRVTGTGLRNMWGPLNVLYLHGCPITDEGLEAICTNHQLGELYLTSPHVTDEGAAHVAKLQKLDQLKLINSQITDKAVKYIAEAGHVRLLWLCNTSIGDETLAGLRPWNLGWLELSRTQITDAGLKYLAEIRSLDHLNLSDTKLTDAGVVQLKHLRRLRHLDLSGTQVTQQGIAELKRNLPDCNIVADRISQKVMRAHHGS